MLDLHPILQPVELFPPVAATTDNTVYTSNVVDTQNANGNLLTIQTGALGANSSYQVAVYEGDLANGTDGVLADPSVLLGITANPTAAFFTAADHNRILKIGYIGIRRYLKVVITPTLNSGNTFITGSLIRGGVTRMPVPL